MDSLRKLVFASVLFALAISALLGQTKEPTLTKMTATFTQTNDDKDWNTQVRVYVVCNGHTVASRICCSADHDGDHWKDPGNPHPVPLDVLEHPGKEQLNKCVFRVGAQASGHDIWQFTSNLHADFSDGTVREWDFPETSLDSKHSQLVNSSDFKLSEHHH